ncbi:MAG: DNA cytosine methyltransferase [Gammaproteobacteria bacterium]|nr:DNA cytosine methyltransferase [Gammaproteobacteria bacterium]MBU1733503.1 DNA cytosine methyltransferase [Gammaproteobacteria bacterium]MBU1891920.1 DNA cytosine methyltransferase [Gammaproteobacteria bacterium]
MNELTAVSLFSGAGGMDVGFERAGFTILAGNELDTYACKTYRLNHPKSKLHEGDINEHMDRLAAYRNVDVVFGGPPCQGFSVAGKMNPNDPRSKLVFSFAKVVAALRPRVFVMENVKALASLEKFQKIREELFRQFSELGYSVSMNILNAKDYGSAQNRERVFFVGSRDVKQGTKLSTLLPYKQKALSVRDIIQHLGAAGSETNPRICKAKITLAARPILRKSPYAGMLFNGQGRPLNPDGWSSTLPASMGGNRTPIIDEHHLYDYKESWVEQHHASLMKGQSSALGLVVPGHLRRLTIDEAALLQGFPADYQFAGPQSKVYCQIGNAVPCTLAEAVASAVRDLLAGKDGAGAYNMTNTKRGQTLELLL